MKQKGFTLIEVMLSITIMFVPLFAVMQLTVSMQRQMRGMNLSLEITEFIQEVMLSISRPDTCTAALFNQPVSTIVATDIDYQQPGGPLVHMGTNINGVYFNRVQIKNLVPIPGYPTQFFAKLYFDMTKTGDVAGSAYAVRMLPLKLEAIAGKVVDCIP